MRSNLQDQTEQGERERDALHEQIDAFQLRESNARDDRDTELERLQEELRQLRHESSTREQQDNRLAALSEKAERLETLRSDLQAQAEEGERERDALLEQINALQQRDSHAPDEREMLRLRARLSEAQHQAGELREELSHRDALLNEIHVEMQTVPIEATPPKAKPNFQGFDESVAREFIPINEGGGTEAEPILAEILREKNGGFVPDRSDRDYPAIILAGILGLIGLTIIIWVLLT
ncbi:MAG: hypothetical protein O7G85_00190 [Planctomycetota bacterium]|nr:hypothetical protein [Planctomycetota bacterium]